MATVIAPCSMAFILLFESWHVKVSVWLVKKRCWARGNVGQHILWALHWLVIVGLSMALIHVPPALQPLREEAMPHSADKAWTHVTLALKFIRTWHPHGLQLNTFFYAFLNAAYCLQGHRRTFLHVMYQTASFAGSSLFLGYFVWGLPQVCLACVNYFILRSRSRGRRRTQSQELQEEGGWMGRRCSP